MERQSAASFRVGRSVADNAIGIFQELRPQQWVKNVFLAAGLVFSGQIVVTEALWRVILGMAIFCIISGTVYIINDLVDLENDRMHPAKAKRPLAAGRIGRQTALAAAGLLTISAAGAISLFSMGIGFAAAAGAYYLLTMSYSLILKRLVILDVMAIAGGFILRVVAGCLVIGVRISPWIVVCSLLLALFLALCKRRHELLLLGDGSASHRSVLKMYSLNLIDQMIAVTMSATIMTYSLYTFYAGHTPWMMATIPLVIYGLFRFLYLTYNEAIGGSAEQMFRDRPMMIDFALWGIISAIIMRYNGG